MIRLSELPRIVQTRLRHDPLIYIASNEKRINIDSLSTIVLDDDVAYIVDILPKNNYKSGKHPFYLQHSDLFKNAQTLFYKLFGHVPDKLIFAYKSDFTSSIFLFSSSVLIDKAIKEEEIIIKWKERTIKNELQSKLNVDKKLGINFDNIYIEDDIVNVYLPKGVFPFIGALNSIDSGWRTPNFNLIFGTEYNDSFDNISFQIEESNFNISAHKNWISNIDNYLINKFVKGISLYSIKKFDFKTDKYLSNYYNPNSMESFFEAAIEMAKESFSKTIINFLLAVNRSSCLPLNNLQFSSFMPHFYGYDRLVESVMEYDIIEKLKLKRLYNSADKFASGYKELTCKNLIDFFFKRFNNKF